MVVSPEKPKEAEPTTPAPHRLQPLPLRPPRSPSRLRLLRRTRQQRRRWQRRRPRVPTTRPCTRPRRSCQNVVGEQSGVSCTHPQPAPFQKRDPNAAAKKAAEEAKAASSSPGGSADANGGASTAKGEKGSGGRRMAARV